VLFSLDPTVDTEVTIKGERLTIYFGPFRPKRARDFFAEEIKWLRQSVLKHPPDILHAHWTYEYALAAQATRLPHLITAHDAPFNILKHNFIPYRIVRTIMACKAIWAARYLSVVSPYVGGHLKKFLFYRRPFRVIPNGMPKAVFNRTKPAKPIGEPITFATILTSWSSLKNGVAAIEAFALVRNSLPDSRLIMFGPGHGQNEEAEVWAKASGIATGIEFRGQTQYNDLMDMLCNEVDILVHPALEEAQPMSLIEAMCIGIPVIAGHRSGGVPWTLNYGEGGVLVDITQPEQIAKAMLKLANDANERNQIGQSGQTLARQRFHISAVTDAYLQAYQDISTGSWT